MLSGSKIAGGNPKSGRVENDFYATNPKAVEMLFKKYKFTAKNILEPCVGQGNIANEVIKYFGNEVKITSCDIVDRGYKGTIVADFLKYDFSTRFDGIITNPPYSMAKEFIEKSISLLGDNGTIVMFLKIQFLEGAKRASFFNKFPPKYIYVFRNRMATWKNGEKTDEHGKNYSTTMCHAWFIWEKANGEMSKSEPVIRWL